MSAAAPGSLQAKVLQRLARKAAQQQHHQQQPVEPQQGTDGSFYAEPVPPLLPPRAPGHRERPRRSGERDVEAPPPRRGVRDRATAARPRVTAASEAWRQEMKADIGGFDSSSSSSSGVLSPESDHLSSDSSSGSKDDLEVQRGRAHRRQHVEHPQGSGARLAPGSGGAKGSRHHRQDADPRRGKRERERDSGESDFDAPAKKTAGGRDIIQMWQALMQGRLCSKKDLARCVRRRRKGLRMCLATTLGLYVAGLLLAAEGSWDPLSGASGAVPADLRIPLKDEGQLREEAKVHLTADQWKAAGFGDAPLELRLKEAEAAEALKQRAAKAASARRR